jgi:hypothetical protein
MLRVYQARSPGRGRVVPVRSCSSRRRPRGATRRLARDSGHPSSATNCRIQSRQSARVRDSKRGAGNRLDIAPRPGDPGYPVGVVRGRAFGVVTRSVTSLPTTSRELPRPTMAARRAAIVNLRENGGLNRPGAGRRHRQRRRAVTRSACSTNVTVPSLAASCVSAGSSVCSSWTKPAGGSKSGR